MKNIRIKADQLKKFLINKLEFTYVDTLDQITINQLRPVAYTSFDGDNLSYSELMKQFAFDQEMIPLNPESALGTYLVTNHYLGEKYKIIEDCFKLLLICDIFFVMSNFEEFSIKDFTKFPEGVIAEIIYWCRYKNSSVNIVNITKYKHTSKFETHNNFLDFLHPLQKDGINKIVNTDSHLLRKTVYLLSGEKHAKHADWMRKDAYNNNKIPLCPYTLFNKGSLQLAYGIDELKHYIARQSLSIRADEIWVYGVNKDQEFEFSNLETDVLIELYLTLKLKQDNVKIVYKYFGEIGIPKYSKENKWAITEFEKAGK